MIPSPIRRALSTIRTQQVAHLLMGGQACVLYGAAEFSRDLDLALLPDPANLEQLRGALRALDAISIAVPPPDLTHLQAGLAIHFRCRRDDVAGLRIDVMTHMRGVAPFVDLWARRTTFTFGDEIIDVMSLPDLVVAKKTQRDKDWPMIRRLVDANYLNHRHDPTPERVRFWLRELRTPELLIEAIANHQEMCRALSAERPLLRGGPDGLTVEALDLRLQEEQASERRRDAAYWKPRREQLEQLRRAAKTSPLPDES